MEEVARLLTFIPDKPCLNKRDTGRFRLARTATSTSPDSRNNAGLANTSLDGSSYLVMYGGERQSTPDFTDTWTFGGGDYSLPVELSAFTAEHQAGSVLLKWMTESETENLGFVLEKRILETGSWLPVADYRTDKALQGHGSTSEKHEYHYTDKAVTPGTTYRYRMADVDYGGKVTWHKEVEVKVEAESVQISEKFGLQPVYPNPFNPAMTIPYGLTEDGQMTLKVYNLRGQLVETLVNTYALKGTYSYTWQPLNLSAGIYFIQLQSGNKTNLQKVVFVK